MDWRPHRLTDRLTDWLTDWLTHSLTHKPTDSLTDWVTDLLNDWLIHWLTDWRTDWLSEWFTHWLNETQWLAYLSACVTESWLDELINKETYKQASKQTCADRWWNLRGELLDVSERNLAPGSLFLFVCLFVCLPGCRLMLGIGVQFSASLASPSNRSLLPARRGCRHFVCPP